MTAEGEALLAELASRHPSLAGVIPSLRQAVEMVRSSLTAGGVLYLAGNGGSAADAEHIAGELLKGFLKHRRLTPEQRRRLLDVCGPEAGAELAARLQGGLRAVALTGHPALTSAVCNDIGAELVYAQQLYALGRPGDVFLGLSTSGNARNVILAAHVARALGLRVIGLTGCDGGALAGLCDVPVRVPARRTFEVQELHLPLYHAFCALLEAAFFAE
ncbi:MAG: Phosphoheptose isomerase [Lentisphaerae bacterium ADurb.BinA184]|nr:MAG: Phosphoheptose isomerase [Lentisphaerae bacterium ADurb.BinA184]